MCKYQINLLNDSTNNLKGGSMSKSKYHVNMLKGIAKEKDIDDIIEEYRYTDCVHMQHMCTLADEMSSMFEDERPAFMCV